MATEVKSCPKCSTEMGWSQNVLVIPAANNPSVYNDPVSTKAGLPVLAFCCPNCKYVELYLQRV
jgi:predicted nucleic-acid-binding Zn-ribbon protein